MFVPFLSERKISKTSKNRTISKTSNDYKRTIKYYNRPTSPQDRGIIASRGSSVNFFGVQRSVNNLFGGGGATTNVTVDPFKGRTAGGATRAQVGSGSPIYGSGYPGVSGRGTAGRNFPFYYMPLVYESPDLDYLNPPEYGGSQSSNRPGGPMKYATIEGLKRKQTLRVVSDASTVASLITDIRVGCGSKLTMSVAPNAVKGPFDYDPKVVRPESTIQYFRASSISLEFDGYNNSAVFAEKDGAPNTPFPIMDAILTGCVIKTINQAAPLVVTSAGAERWERMNVGTVLLLIVGYHYLSMMF